MSERKFEAYEVRNSLRQQFESTLGDQVRRYLQAKPHTMTPNTHFAAVSAEVTKLFTDGHYYGSIALSQAVAEALVKFMCQRNCFRPAGDFSENIQKLCTREFITEDLKTKLELIWEDRNNYHHLNPNIERDNDKLKALALHKAQLLAEVESEVFAYTAVDGEAKFENPQYWDSDGKYANVFLKFSL